MLRYRFPLLLITILTLPSSWAAEVTVRSQTPVAAARIGTQSPAYRLQCWQNGVKVIDEDGLFEISPNAVSHHQAISFKSVPGGAKTTFLLTTLDSLCLIKATY